MRCCAAGKEFDRKLSAPLILSWILDSDDTFIAHITKGVKKLSTPTLTWASSKLIRIHSLIELFLSYNLIYNALSYHKHTLSYERFFAKNKNRERKIHY